MSYIRRNSPALNWWLKRFLAQAIPVLYFLIAVAFYLQTYDSAQIKITLWQIGGGLVFTLGLFRLLEEKKLLDRRFLILGFPLFLYLLSGIFSFFHSVYPGASVDEFIRRIFYIGIALITLHEFNSREKIDRLLRWLMLATFVVCLYGFIQYLDTRYFPPPPERGIDPFIWRHAFTARIFSTFGNPNFFGNFLVIVSPILLALFLKTRYLSYILLFVMATFCLIITYSKGAWLGYAAGCAIFTFLALYYFSPGRSLFLRRLLIAFAVAVVLIAGAGIAYMSKQRVDSLRFRIFTWLSTWEMIRTHPVIGSGIGTFKITYPAYRRPEIFYIEGRHNTETDHPEDEYLEVWYDEGLLGIGIFLWLILTFSWIGLRALRLYTRDIQRVTDQQGRERWVLVDERGYYLLGFLTAFWAMLFHNTVDVSLRFVSSGVFLWLLAGIIGALVLHNPLPEVAEPPTPQHDRGVRIFLVALWSVFFLNLGLSIQGVVATAIFLLLAGEILEYKLYRPELSLPNYSEKLIGEEGSFFLVNRFLQVFLLIFYAWGYLVFRGYFLADRHHNQAIFYSKRAEWGEALKHYREVIRQNPYFTMAHYFMGNVYNDRGQNDDWKIALQKYDDVKKLSPNYVQIHHQVGLLYLKKGEEARQAGKEEEALAFWKRAMENFEKYRLIDPVYPQNYYQMGWIYLQLNQLEKAEELYAEATRRRPRQTLEGYINLGNVRYLLNKYPEAEEAFRKALELDPKNIVAMKNLAVLYGKTERKEEAIRLWYKLRELRPDDPDVQRVFSSK